LLVKEEKGEKISNGDGMVALFIEVRWGAEEGGRRRGRPHGGRGDVGAQP
jgi:hypothetical protein